MNDFDRKNHVLDAFIPDPWHLRVACTEAPHHTMPLCIDFLPHRHEIVIGSQPQTGVTAEFQSGYLYRHFLTVYRIESFKCQPFLMELGDSLFKIEHGFHAELLWSGDWYCQWSKSAWQNVQYASALLEKCIIGPLRH